MRYRFAVTRAVVASAVIVVVVLAGVGIYSLNVGTPTATTTTTVSTSSSTPTTPRTFTTTTSAASTTKPLQKLTIILDYVPLTYEAVFYYGVVHGIYVANGIDLSIYPGSGSAAAIAAVTANKFDFGLTDLATLTVSTSQQNITNVKAVALVVPSYPFAIIYNKAVISKPSDLNGKTMSSFPGSGGQAVFKAFAKLNGVDINTTKVVYATAANFAQVVALGKADFTPATISQLVITEPTARANNIQLGAFVYKDYGVNVMGYPIITTTSLIKENPGLVRAFVNATMWSLLGTLHNPKDAIDGMAKLGNPTLDTTSALAGFRAIIKISYPANANSTSNALELGWMDPTSVQNTINIVAQSWGLTKIPSPSQLYTDEFVKPLR